MDLHEIAQSHAQSFEPPQVIAILPSHLDSTMIACFRSCERKFYNEFVCGYRPEGLSVDLHAGGCFATALESVYKSLWRDGLPFHEALLRAHAAFHVAWGDFEIPQWKNTSKTRERMWDAVESYFATYPPQTDHVQPYFDSNGAPTFEYTFAIPLDFSGFPTHPNGDPFIYCGKFDMLGQYNGHPVVRDEKTTGATIGSLWSRQWTLRSQFMGYVWACRQCGIPVQEVVIRGIAIQKTQIVHAEDIHPYPDFLIEAWFNRLRQDVVKIRQAWDSGEWQYDLAEACTSYGTCVFMDACSSRNPESWLSQMEVRRWNPLLKNPAPVRDPSEARALG